MVHEVATKQEANKLFRSLSLEEVNEQGEMSALVATVGVAFKSDLPSE
ncbi:MAG: hypothetical protein V1898_05255 [Patescibacteria group bacterium]